eukprot:TRINITY_DN4502_c0_g4_i1.p1 TRINITY_DN4502_c0_g4~~TRINITY_DN4502_c0_g4_i1.p1  ORF type:complete len:407 (+),score=96.43 TRINITY_DN4502_c0_g4_i1:152-1372(+)
MGMKVPFFLKVGFGVAVVALALQLQLLYSDPAQVQGSLCSLSSAMRAAFPLPDPLQKALVDIHRRMSSFFWMQLSTAITFVENYDDGTEFYLYVTLGHIVKNFFKTFLQSPRGFWFCTEGSAPYCGTGNSLPSGHLMMSAAFFLLAYYRRPSKSMLRVILVIQSFLFLEVIYLGTHSLMDNTVGMTFGVLWFCLYRFWKNNQHTSSSSPISSFLTVESLLLFCSVFLAYALERLETQFDDSAEISKELQSNYENYCNLSTGSGAKLMRNSTAYEKTALLLGVSLGYFLRNLVGITEVPEDDTNTLPRKLTRTFISLAVLTYMSTGISFLFQQLVAAGVTSSWWWFEEVINPKYVVLVLQPLWVLVLAPLLFHTLRLGNYFATNRWEDDDDDSNPINNNNTTTTTSE